MGRFPSPPATRGSQKWIQQIINHEPRLLDERLKQVVSGAIEWLSPLASDDYSEYRDEAGLALLGIESVARPLREFWPARGPQWDALGRTMDGAVLLVEAKAHVGELISGSSGARSPKSVTTIAAALDDAANWLRASPKVPWNGPFYQYANRLAHLYYLRQVCGVAAYLVFVYFVGDEDMKGPDTKEQWEGAIELVHRLLGLSRAPEFVVDVFIDVEGVLGS